MEELLKKINNFNGSYKNILIYINGSPDPDAIASSFALQIILSVIGIDSKIVAEKKLSLPQNKLFVEKLKIPISYKVSSIKIKDYQGYAILDFQSPDIDFLSDKLPCLIHIDHHKAVESSVAPTIKYIDEKVGSASTILTFLIQLIKDKITEESFTTISTALLYGIQTDTDKYEHASAKDYEAIKFLSPFADNVFLNSISNIPVSRESMELIYKAIDNKQIYKEWLITGIGVIDKNIRDEVAMVADFLLKREEVNTCVVTSLVKDKSNSHLWIDTSFRTQKGNIDLDNIIKEITPNGGGRKYKGAFQINIDYFYDAPDQELLWQTVLTTTMEIIKKKRDELYVTEIKGAYKDLKGRIVSFFKSLKNK